MEKNGTYIQILTQMDEKLQMWWSQKSGTLETSLKDVLSLQPLHLPGLYSEHYLFTAENLNLSAYARQPARGPTM